MKAYRLNILLISIFTIGLVTVNAVAKEPISKTWASYEVSKLLGSDVENPQGETLGKVTDFIVDSNGVIEFAIVQVRISEAGCDSHPVAVPFAALSRSEGNVYVLNMTREKLASAPRFDAKKGSSGREFGESVYRDFGLEPSWTEGVHEKWFRSDQDPFDLVG